MSECYPRSNLCVVLHFPIFLLFSKIAPSKLFLKYAYVLDILIQFVNMENSDDTSSIFENFDKII